MIRNQYNDELQSSHIKLYNMVHELKNSLSGDEEVILKDFHNKRRIETQKTNQISALINELTGERTH